MTAHENKMGNISVIHIQITKLFIEIREALHRILVNLSVDDRQELWTKTSMAPEHAAF